MKKRMIRKREGFLTIYTILWLAVLLPFCLFVVVDVTHYVSSLIYLKQVTDNATDAAVTQIEQSLISQGTLKINEDQAAEAATNILVQSLNLNSDLTIKDHKLFSENPTISLQVYNDVPAGGATVSTPIKNVELQHPSVVIYAEYPVAGLFFGIDHVTIKKVGVGQVQFLR